METFAKPEVVVITGASAGVGRATARKFASAGASVALLARGKQGLEATRSEVEELGGKALVLPTDVADAGEVEAAAQTVMQTWGRIDVWINNAMTTVFSPFNEMRPIEFRRVTEVTYLGTVYGTMAALKRMLPENRGCILQVGSALAYRSVPLQSAYCGAKHAIRGFTDSLRTELIHDRSRVRLTMVQLPGLNTPQFSWVKNRLPYKPQPLPPIYQPEAAAEAIYWAAHHWRRELWVALPVVRLVISNKFVPGILDHYLARAGYHGQQTHESSDPDQPVNLFTPVAGDHGARGEFDGCSLPAIPQLWFATNPHWLSFLGAGLTALGVGWLMRKALRSGRSAGASLRAR